MDFQIGKTMSALTKTLPFIVFRLLIYLGVAIGYLLVIGIGATVGYFLTSFSDEPGSGAGIGGFIGFAVASGVLFWLREYVLYIVKAGHIAVLVEIYDGKTLPGGKGQIAYAKEKVQERFAQTSLLFGLDRLIKGILKAINRTLFSIARFLPVPGLDNLVNIINKIVNLSLTYTDEIIIAHNFRVRSENPWDTSKDAIILYAQNYQAMVKNAFFLMVILYVLTFVIFLMILGPIGALFSLFPGKAGFWAFVLGIIFAWSIKAALLEPFAITAMMQVYFQAIEGQEPNPEWDEKLTAASDKFRELKDKALGTAAAAT